MISTKAILFNCYRRPKKFRFFIYSVPGDLYLYQLQNSIAALISRHVDIMCVIVDWKAFNDMYTMPHIINQYTVQMWYGSWTIGCINKPDAQQLTKFFMDCQKLIARDDCIEYMKIKEKKSILCGNSIFYRKNPKRKVATRILYYSTIEEMILSKEPPKSFLESEKQDDESNQKYGTENCEMNMSNILSKPIKIKKSRNILVSDKEDLAEMIANTASHNFPNIPKKRLKQEGKLLKNDDLGVQVSEVREFNLPISSLQERFPKPEKPQNSKLFLPQTVSTEKCKFSHLVSSSSNTRRIYNARNKKINVYTPSNKILKFPGINHNNFQSNSSQP